MNRLIIMIVLLSLSGGSWGASWYRYYVKESVPAGPGETTDTIVIIVDHNQIPSDQAVTANSLGQVSVHMDAQGPMWGNIIPPTDIYGLVPGRQYTWIELIERIGLPPTTQFEKTATTSVGAGFGIEYRASSVAGSTLWGQEAVGYAWGGTVAACSFNVERITMAHGALMMRVGDESTQSQTITANCNSVGALYRVSVIGGSHRLINNGDLQSVLYVNDRESYTGTELTTSVKITSTLYPVKAQTGGGPVMDTRIILIEVI